MKGSYDVIVVGGGPGGSTCATFLAKQDKDVLLVDKAEFPRDKPCGDAIGGKGRAILKEWGLDDKLEELPHAEMNGVIFSSPKGEVLEIESPDGGINPAGYVCRREVFDNILFQYAKDHVDTEEGFTVTDVIREDGQVVGIKGRKKGSKKEKEIRAKVVVGADGALSAVARSLDLLDHDPKHHIVAVRAYYDGIKDMKDKIELHFVDDIIPGYFWIFPLEDGKANVGIGMVTKEYNEKWKGTKLDDLMYKAIESPMFKERFEDAELLDDVRAWNLPVGSKQRKIHTDGCVLIGDAAGLIDPFSGEGIGNAMVSARMAAERIGEAFEADDFSEEFLKAYEEQVHTTLGSEMQLSYKLQKIGRITPLLNFVISKAANDEELREHISMSLLKEDAKEEFTNPLFYVKMLLPF